MLTISTQEELDGLVNGCFALEDNGAALGCLMDVAGAPKPPELCSPRLVLLTQEGCEGCVEAKEQHRENLRAGLIKEVDFHSEEGRRIAAQAKVDFTPALLVLDCQDRLLGDE